MNETESLLFDHKIIVETHNRIFGGEKKEKEGKTVAEQIREEFGRRYIS